MTNYERRTYLGEEFRAWRESLGLRQRDIGKIAHLSTDTVAAYELGKAGRKTAEILSSSEVIDAILEYADTKTNYIILRDGGLKLPKSGIDQRRIRNYKTMSEIMKRKRVKQEDLVKDFNITYDQINAYRAGVLYDGLTDEYMDHIHAWLCSIPGRNAREHGTNICFDCKNATNPVKCSWARNFTPVDGWTAVEVPRYEFQNPGAKTTYYISRCPLFERG